MIKSGLPTAKIVKVEATNSSGDVTIRSMGQSIDNVIAREAKLQNTSKPDLSRVFISMSLGESKLTLTPYELISAPIARFTALGGTIYASAGNRLLNTTGANPGVGLVYATQSTVGSALSSNPKPAQSLRSGTFELGDGQINKIPTNRIDPTSHVYVGAGTLSQRYNPATGAVENQNPKGDWISAVDATRVTADPVKGMAATGPLNNIRPSAEVTAKDVERFDAWRTTSENTAIAKHPMPAGSKKKATYDDLTTAEKNSLNARSKTEFTRRFGTTSVITVAHSKTAALMIQGSDRAAFFDQSLPTGLTPQTAYIPAEAFVLDNKRPDEGTTDFYSRDASGLMRHAISYVSSSVSTSAATPDMVVRAVQDRAVRLAKTKGVGGSSQP